MRHLILPLPAFLAAFLLACIVLPAAGQQSPPPLLRSQAVAPLLHAAAQQTPAPYVLRRYRVEALDPENLPAYQPVLETTYTYRDGRPSEVNCDWMASSHFDFNCNRMTFDYGPGNLVTRTGWQWHDGSPSPDYRYIEDFDELGRPTVSIKERYDVGRGVWEKRRRSTITFAHETHATSLEEEWDGEGWVVRERLIFAEQDGVLTGTEQRWEGTGWVNDSRKSVANYTLGQVMEYSSSVDYDGLFLTPDRALAEFIYALESSDEIWDGSGWRPASRTRILSNTGSELVSVEEEWDGGAWAGETRTTLTFDGQRTTSIATEAFDTDESAWKPDDKTLYTYDANGNVTLIENFDGEAAMAGSRVFIEWADITTAIDADDEVGLAQLTAVQPSPASGAATVHFSLAQPGMVLLRVFDVLGREVALLASGTMGAGSHTARLDASSLPSGVYFVRIEAEGVSETRSLVIAR